MERWPLCAGRKREQRRTFPAVVQEVHSDAAGAQRLKVRFSDDFDEDEQPVQFRIVPATDMVRELAAGEEFEDDEEGEVMDNFIDEAI